jgi:hypothetical protein
MAMKRWWEGGRQGSPSTLSYSLTPRDSPLPHAGEAEAASARQEMASQLHASVASLQLLDAPLCVCYASVAEDALDEQPLPDPTTLLPLKRVCTSHAP